MMSSVSKVINNVYPIILKDLAGGVTNYISCQGESACTAS